MWHTVLASFFGEEMMLQFLDYLDPKFGTPNDFKAEDLYERMVMESRGKVGVRFVELGTNLGRSACYMAQVIWREGAKIDFVTVDLFPDTSVEATCRGNLQPYVDAGLVASRNPIAPTSPRHTRTARSILYSSMPGTRTTM
jgi:hypothetical protein